ncbi:equilibrative nucleoside transporter 1 [Galendromus occidentalis]|uniref:Equilibrative nucleoside transporter 1 n=1 Tax=Galendromus occidentalis TaxID=34638 RepID=A0AAJ7L5C1_9ACAR|nr:equilibrative nucleoside transporter 1 [Galendromus occidentalis]XP_018494395.1 equilibrative nucleoside transporter 1 [Galendromus occidentalis]XP_018494396.1 equilibrative nucleoside transporter 1 [Galendromus occidentalis]
MTLNTDTSVSYHRPESESLLGDSKTAPVTLGPGWESRHSNSDLVHSSKMDEEKNTPSDRCNFLFLILMLHGVGTLMPWNMFITAKEFFTEVKLNTSLIPDTTSTDFSHLKTYNAGFMGYIILANQLPNLIFNFINLFVQFGADSLGPRIAGSLIFENVLFILTSIMVMLDTSGWPIIFFFGIMSIVVLLGAAGGIYQNSIFGLAANLPGKYTGAIVLGTNVSGTLISSVSILTTYAAPSPKTAAIYYFISALFILLLCLDTYFALPLLKIFRYHQKRNRQIADNAGRKPSLIAVFKECWFNCLNVFLCFFATLACFPGITSEIVAVDENFPVSSTYYVKLFCFLFFNLFAMIGNMLPAYIKFPSAPGQTFFWVLIRLLFIPFFMMCNFSPDKRITGTLFSDYVYIGGMVLFGLTHGHLSSLAMMQSTYRVADKHANLAGMMAAFFLVLGIFLGGNSIFLIKYLFLQTPAAP